MSRTHKYTHHMVPTTAIHCDTPLKLNRPSSPYHWLTRALSSPFTSHFSPQVWNTCMSENQAHCMDPRPWCIAWVHGRNHAKRRKSKIAASGQGTPTLIHIPPQLFTFAIFGREILHTHKGKVNWWSMPLTPPSPDPRLFMLRLRTRLVPEYTTAQALSGS